MSRSYVWTMSNTAVLGQRKQAAVNEIKIGPMAWKYALILIVFMSGLFYLTQSTTNATINKDINTLKDKLATEIQETKDLEATVVQHAALSEVDEAKGKFGLVPFAKMDYVITPGGGFAGQNN